MSRIGRMPIPVPAGVKVELDGEQVTVSGPRGELSRTFHPELKIYQDGNVLRVERPNDTQQFRALHGLTRALLNNMVVGVTDGYRITLEIHGTGYRAELQGTTLVLYLGFSHPVVIPAPDNVKFDINVRANTVTVEGIDKEVVGRLASEIRGWRPVDPYLGKGVRYLNEVVRRKAGKTGKA
ncbi:MAG: 50S ribosomal protein L6 [Anaerolineae bacterium]|nr:50S ribosomal protein L6 [Anaerolineae bacterium]